MARIDLYRNVHKGQRALLFGLAEELGRTDFGESAASAVRDRLRDALAELRAHADHEEKFIHPLLHARAPGVASALEREHRAVETALCSLEHRLRSQPAMEEDPAAMGAELYQAWCRMLSAYLAHLDAEENLAMPALWKACSDAEILAVIESFVASRSESDQLRDLRSQAPSLTPQERAAYVGSILRGSKLPHGRVWEQLAEVLSAGDMARLSADLSQAARPRADRAATISPDSASSDLRTQRSTAPQM